MSLYQTGFAHFSLDLTQDIIQSYQVPLSTESFELPDVDILNTRLLGIAYEHGLVDGISKDVPDIVLAGLEYHLRDFLQQIFGRVMPSKRRYFSDREEYISFRPSDFTQSTSKANSNNKVSGSHESQETTGEPTEKDVVSSHAVPTSSSNSTTSSSSAPSISSTSSLSLMTSSSLLSSVISNKKNGRSVKRHKNLAEEDNVITAEDMALALELAPHSIVESNGPFYRLYNVMLQDEMDDLQVST